MKKIFLLLFFLSTVSLNAFLPAGSAAFSTEHLPTVIITRTPKVVVIPGTRYVYFLPDYDEDILFYHGFWYRPYSGGWFRSKGYNGPWKPVRKVPGQVLNLPPDFRGDAQAGERISYRELKKHWRQWEKSGYWEESAKKAREKKKASKKAARKPTKPKPADKKTEEPVKVVPPAAPVDTSDKAPAGPQGQETDKGTGEGIDGKAAPGDTTVKEPGEGPK